jgi:hypothetical protein
VHDGVPSLGEQGEVHSLGVHDEVHSLEVHDEVHSMDVHDEVHSLGVHDEVHGLGVQDEVHSMGVCQGAHIRVREEDWKRQSVSMLCQIDLVGKAARLGGRVETLLPEDQKYQTKIQKI